MPPTPLCCRKAAPEFTSKTSRPRSALLGFGSIVLLCIVACTKQQPSVFEPKTEYEKRLVATKSVFQFEHWPTQARPAVAAVFEKLLSDLLAAGETASEAQKAECFKRAVAMLNKINQRDLTVIATMEREQLVYIGNQVAAAAGLDPKKFGHGEGPISEGRDW